MTVTPPSVEYGLLSPMLIVFGVAVVGVLVEAFLPRGSRYRVQLVLAIGGQLAALVAVVKESVDLHASVGQTAVVGAVAVDRPALFLQGTLLLVGILGTLLMAERRLPVRGGRRGRSERAWTPSPRRPPRCPAASPRRWPRKPVSRRPRSSR